jgi:class 3 adenylate cyclase/tetratricopeptide (TPR) repeat protein
VRCSQCQHDNPPGARFCNACGAPLEAGCPACGRLNPPESRFCNACGSSLAAPRAAPIPRFTSPEAYTPQHLALKILTSRSALESERKQVTVLFADVKGSLELLADRDPEEARALLDPALELMMEAVHRYEGTVNQVMGDGIMALFGAPVAHEDHAVRACYAALTMQREMRRHTDALRRAQGIEIRIRVGLNSGEVVVRAIGSDLRMDYSAVGQTTHLAARMEQLAPPEGIRLTAETARLVEGFVELAPLGPVPVKGVPDPVEVYELVGAAATRTRLQAAAARGLTRFVGRQAERARLLQALVDARGGQGQLVAVVGEAGVGKSRLFWEVVRSPQIQDCLVVESSSVSYGKAAAYLPVIDLLRAYFRIDSRDGARAAREKITGKLLALDEGLRPALPALLALLEVPGEGSDWERLDAPQRRRRVAGAVKHLLVRESHVQPVVAVLEDLHWLDADSQAVLDELIESLPAARILLLVNYRPGYHHDWGSKTYYTQLRLDPLRAESADELLRVLVGAAPDLEPLKRLLVSRTEGNPLFIEECVRSLVELRALAGEPGAYRLARALDSVQVPASIQALLAARIDRLEPSDKALLQTAAVIGTDVALDLLRAVTGLPEDALRLGLSRLQTAEFVYEASVFPDVEYTFKHALTHEVAYGGLLQERRRALHARVVEAFEALRPAPAAEHASWLAQHAFRGEVWGKAVGYLRQTLTPSPDRVDVMGGPESAGRLWWMGEHAAALRIGQRELAIAGNFRNLSMQVVANLRLGQVYHSLGDYPRAIEYLARNVDALGGDLAMDPLGVAGLPSVLSLSWLALCLGEQGEFAAALGRGAEGVRIAEVAAHAYSLIVACAGLGSVQLLQGDPGRATALLEQGVVLARVHDIAALFPLVGSALGSAYALSGRLREAIVLLEQAMEQAAAMKLAAMQALRLTRLGEAHLAAGSPDRAADLARRALDLARELGERGHEAGALRLVAEVAALGGPPEVERAEGAYGEALALTRRLGMRPLEARCREGLGLLHRRLGREDQARAELAAAGELRRGLQMPPGSPAAEALC